MSVRLRALREDEFDDWAAQSRASYADDMVANGGVSRELALAKAEADFERALPLRLASPSQFLFAIEGVETGERVGDVWFAERETEFEGTIAFVFSIEVRSEFRGRGFGKGAMLALEDEVRSRGLSRISLNVFGGNEVARSLYRTIGYAETAVWMTKDL